MKKVDYTDVGTWLPECERARNRRGMIAEELEWKKMRELWNAGTREVTLYRESTEQGSSPLLQTAYVNWVNAYKEVFIPAVYWRHPKILVRPSGHAFQEAAKFVEPLINATMKRCKFRQTARRVMNDALAFGHGWCKIGWFTQFGEVAEGPRVPAKGFSKISNDRFLKQDTPYCYRVPVDSMLVDPDARVWEEVRWVAQEYHVDVEDFEGDPHMLHKKDVSLVAFPDDRGVADLPTDDAGFPAGEHARWVRMLEIWDRENRRVLFHGWGSKKFNRIIDGWPWEGIDGFPYKMLCFTDNLEDIFPSSVILPWLPLVEELAFIRSMRLEHLSKMCKKMITTERNFNERQRKALLDPSIDLVTCADPKELFDFDGLKPDPNMYASEEEVKKDIREVSGFSEILSGQVPFSRIAATTSAIMERNATLRFDNYSEWMGDWIIDVARDLFQIVRRYQEYPVTMEIAGATEPEWIELGADQLKGEFHFHLDLEDMSISSKQQRVKEEFDALSVLAQFPEVRRHPLIKDFLIAIGKNDIPLYLNPPAGPPADPGWENQMLSQGYPVEPNPSEDFALHLRVHTMFMQQPQFQQLVRVRPEVGKLFNEHIQITSQMAQASQALGGPAGGPSQGPPGGGGPATPQGMQQGGAPMGSQPPGGQPNVSGGSAGFDAMRRAQSQGRGSI